MPDSVYIVATGARTPVGLQAATSAAAVRAGISGLGEHPFLVDSVGDPMPCALDALLDPSLAGPERLLALIETALGEACLPLTAAAAPCPQLVVYLGLPEFRPGFSAQDAESVRSALARLEGLPMKLLEVNVLPQGHAAGLSALSVATAEIHKGRLEACLIGGVDSYFQPETMAWLDAHRQLAGTVSRSGFVPGEGAGFCLLASERFCQRMKLPALARVLAVGSGNETKLVKTEEVCLGEGLTKAVQDALDSMPTVEAINAVICDINGERYRGEEWGFVCLRLSHYFDDPTAYLSPADCWGDMGAASGPLFAMLVCEAAARGYSKGPRVMLWASSEGGERSVAVLETTKR